MRTHNSDTDTLIAALQGDLPSVEDDARMRARLASAGACVGASIAGVAALNAGGVDAVGLSAASAGGAPGGALLGAGAAKGASAVAGVKTGIFSTLSAALPLAGGASVKTLIVASAIATGLGYPLLAPKITAVLDSPASESRVGSAVSRGADESERNEVRVESAARAPRRVEVRATVQTAVEPPAVKSMVERPRTQAARRPDPNASPKALESGPSRAAGVETNAVSASSPTANVLAEETLLIERALKAQRSGDTLGVRHWLSVHQQRFPHGDLTIERNRMLAQLQD